MDQQRARRFRSQAEAKERADADLALRQKLEVAGQPVSITLKHYDVLLIFC